MSSAVHEVFCMNNKGPPLKTKYSIMTDSEQVL